MQNEQQNLKTLCDIIDPEPSGDDDRDTQYDVGVVFSDQYDLLEIHTYFGLDEFMEIYTSTINGVRQQELQIQATLCSLLLEKIENVYDFSFDTHITLLRQRDLDKVYDLAEFLQYNNLKFITGIWKSFGLKNIVSLDVEDFFTSNKDNFQKLIEQITNRSLMYSKDSLINHFLNICNKEISLFMITQMTNKWRIEISANLMKG